MKKLAHFSALLLLLLPGLAWSLPQAQTPPGATPPTFPQDQSQPPVAPLPPDTQAPAQQTLSTEQVQQQIQSKLDTEPSLRDLQLTVAADDSTVTLKGNVESDDQHDAALRIAKSYAGDRKIVDKLVVKQKA